MNTIKISNFQSGQALVSLLVIMVSAIIITTGAVAVTIINSQTAETFATADETVSIAETGIDAALSKLLRNPYYSGETITVGNGTATVSITGTTTKTIVSEGVNGNFRRKIQAVANFDNNVLNLVSWNEID